MADQFSGDPYLTIGPDGATLTYIGGQPVMDRGLENQAIIALFSGYGWAGNYLFNDPNQRLNSKFVEIANEPTTLQNLTDLEQEAVRVLADPAFGRVTAEASNPRSDTKVVRILIEPPGQDQQTIILSRNGINWQAQAEDPAHERV